MKLKLYCFPFAGASANMFQKWNAYIDKNIELIPIEYPGHGRRLTEDLCTDLSDMINDVYNRIVAETKTTTFAFFGHSVGALIAFELCRQLQKNGEKLPVNIFFSGHVAPHYTKIKKVIFDLPDNEFIKEIISYGGTEPEIFASEELKEVFLPILRADLKAADTYAVEDSNFRLNTNFEIFYSTEDFLLNDEGIAAWNELTSQKCKIITMEGNHMYLLTREKDITTLMNQTLAQYIYSNV